MTKNINSAIKIIIIFIVAILVSWIMRKVFGDLYVFIVQPEHNVGALLMLPTTHYLEGFLIAYAFFASLLPFLFAKKQWLVWIIIMLPLLLISIGTWKMFIWYLAMALIAWLLAQGILLIYKQVKK